MASVGGDGGDSLSLNLTPMLDIFSILVTFLLMSYSTDPVNHDLDENLELPMSISIVNMDEIPTISVDKKVIRVNDKVIVTLENGKVPEKDISQGAVMPLFTELDIIREQTGKLKERLGELPKDEYGKKKKPGTITLEFDKTHNFELLKSVMVAGQQADFITFKLLVAKESID